MPLFFTPLKRLVIRRHFSCVKFDLLTARLSGFPSLPVQSDEISSLNHFFFSSAPLPLSLTASLRVGLTAPDLVQLQWSSGRQRCLLNSFHFRLLLLLRSSSSFSLSSSVDLPFSLQHLSFFPLSLSSTEQSHLQDAVAEDAV